jgi:hypothetical protein
MDRADEIHRRAASMAAVVVDLWAGRNRHCLPGGLVMEVLRDLEYEIAHVLRPLIARVTAGQAITPAEARALVPFRGTIKQTGASPTKHPPVRRSTRKSADAGPGSK